ncbi:uncharacterized protein N7443_002064 [Penicillium atrosanguineum]|uniref:uncharacterized protein n=1 Tax=Penicillium atrosanguineum TaxID=1132637 RepID=UPI0023928428|nr:uncharacterized protein N7443_002064 [Penicillium atrosanguineum]KAJ5309603.1 hypothetical protein N7443_002064 [Penicillium atrosanguineum]
MHALVIGASGRTGKLVVDELLQREHHVTALVRNPAVIEKRDGLSIVKGKLPHSTTSKPQSNAYPLGTPTNISDVRKVFQNHVPDVVIVALSAPRASDSPFAAPISPPRLMTDCNTNVVTVMKESRVKKIVILQALGVGASWPNMSCILRLLMSKSNMSYQYDDHNETDRAVRTSGVTSVLVRPARLVDTDVMATREWPHDGKGIPLMATASRKSVASFLVDAAAENSWDDSAPIISN